MSARKVAFMLVITAAALFTGQLCLVKWSRPGRGPKFLSSLFVGAAQALALLPGISRSGMTISAGLACKMDADEAFRFSFLLSIPAILGALVYKALKVDAGAVISNNSGVYIMGTLAAFVTGLLCLPILRRVIRSKHLFIFGIYCLILGITGILFWGK
jgi:undecaprenyl-diphosphatase